MPYFIFSNDVVTVEWLLHTSEQHHTDSANKINGVMHTDYNSSSGTWIERFCEGVRDVEAQSNTDGQQCKSISVYNAGELGK